MYMYASIKQAVLALDRLSGANPLTEPIWKLLLRKKYNIFVSHPNQN